MKPQREAYESDLSDKDWELIKNNIPKAKSNKKIGGRPEKDLSNTRLHPNFPRF